MIDAAKNTFSSSLAWLASARAALSLLTIAVFCSCCFAQLPADLDLPSETLNSGYLVFQASNSITNSGSNFLVQDPASVTLTAGSYIKLEPGFDAVATTGTATFQAVINANVSQRQPIPVPAPPTPCTDCGADYLFGSVASLVGVYAPNSTKNLYVWCWDSTMTYSVPCNMSLSTAAYESTNCHLHNFPLSPISSISPNSGYTGDYSNWDMPVTLTTTQVGQEETISLLNNDSGYEANYNYAVGYLGLVYIDNSTVFNQIGGNTNSHGDNYCDHYMTVNAATGLQSAATFYINNYNPGQKICINDMALPIGGVFDYKNNNWQPPHKSHDKGTAADVADASGQCPAGYVVNADKFEQACINAGAQDARTEPGHVHCRWAN